MTSEQKTLLPAWAQELRKLNEKGYSYGDIGHANFNALLQALETALGKVERAKTALEFYSPSEKYQYEQSAAPFELLPEIIYGGDEGQTARQALKELEE